MPRFLLAALAASLCASVVSAQSAPAPFPLTPPFFPAFPVSPASPAPAPFPLTPTASAPENPANYFQTQTETDGVVIVKFLDVDAKSVVVPAEIDGRPVVKIDESAFEACDSLTSFSVAPTNPRFKAVDGVLFSKDGKTLLAFPAGKKAKTLKIPNDVETIAENAFRGCDSLTSFSVDPTNPRFKEVDGVLFSKDGKTLLAFPAGKKTRKYQIPDAVETIGESAFSFCDSLRSLEIPSSVETIGESAFQGCKLLTSFSVAPGAPRFEAVDGVLFSADGKTLIAFPAGKKARKYQIPDGVETIAESAFSFCDSLRSLEIPTNVKKIGSGAFVDCRSLTSVKIPASVKEIGERAFFGCSSLTTFMVSPGNSRFKAVDGVLFAADGKTLIAYPAKKETTECQIPTGVEIIGDGAFRFCSSLTSIEIPESVEEIAVDAFDACSPNLTLYGAVGSVAEKYARQNGLRFQKDSDKINDNASQSVERGGKIAVAPNSAETDGASSISANPASDFQTRTENDGVVIVKFLNETATSVVVPTEIDGRPVVKIGDYAFSWHDSLTSVEIPASVETIGDDAFYSCDSLTSVKIPASVETIGDDAFSFCRSLTSVKIPANVETIGDDAFSFCRSLTSVSVAPANERFKSVDGVLFSADGKTLIAYPAAKKTRKYQIPDGVETIGDDAFSFCRSLTSVEIPASVKTIGDNAFSFCRSLTSVSVAPANERFKSVDGVLFSADGKTLIAYPAAKKTRKYQILDGVETIAKSAFYSCRSLRSLEIPSSVETIAESAFYDCRRLTSFSVAPANPRFQAVDGVIFTADGKTLVAYPAGNLRTEYAVPDGCEQIGWSAFCSCDKLESVALPKSLKTVEFSAFNDCRALKSVVVPDGVRKISAYAFDDCASDLTLYGAAGSAAQEYARENNLRFETLETLERFEAR